MTRELAEQRGAAPYRLDAGQMVDRELLVRTEGDRVRHRLDVEHVPRPPVRGWSVEPEALALADGEAERAVVPAHNLAGGIDDRPCSTTEWVAEPAGGVTVTDEADVVAVGLAGTRQSASSCLRAHLG